MTLKRANPNTIQDKLLVGYQGWFTCAGDGEPIGPGHHGWLHWFNGPIPSGGRPNTDIWPDTSDYDPSELYPAPGLTTASGDPVYLFSSRQPRTVRRHFHWMALHGVDGAFLQRFAGQCEVKPGNHGILDLRDEIGDRVREAAEAEGRVFAIMYDVSGVSPDKIQKILEQDWVHLLADKRLLDSPNYLREHGRPVVALWGFGLNDRNFTPDLVRGITEFFRSYTPGGVYLVAGTPGHWRTSTSDADRNPAFVQVWTDCFDAISPWTVGRYGNEEDADRWGEERIKADAEYLKKLAEQGGRKVDYIPVVLPGGSGFNLSEGKWGMNDIRRNGGQFLWRQIYNARRAGVRTIYGAMWDEYDEGTAFMPVVSYAPQLPVHSSFRFIALDIDGHDLPSDWYMRIAGLAAETLHGERTLVETFPFKELQDYWSTRPRHGGTHDAQGDVDQVTRAFGEWQVSGHTEAPTDAPPPYSLEDTSVQHHPQPTAGRTGGPPPVSYAARPSPSLPPSLSTGRTSLSSAVGAAAVPLAAAAAIASAGSGPIHTHAYPRSSTSLPPPVDTATRPTSSRPYHPSVPPPVPQRPTELGGGMPGPGAVWYPQHGGHVPSSSSSFGRGGHGPRPSVGIPTPVPGGVPVEYVRGRSRSRSGSRRRHGAPRSSSSSSSSSSGSRKKKKGRSSVRQHGHGHSLSPVGTQHGMAPGGLYHAYSESGAGYAHAHAHVYAPVQHGSYAPVPSAPVGSAYAPYAPPGQGEGHFPSYQGGGYGYGYPQGQGQGQGYDGVGGSQPYPPHPGHGYTPHPSGSSSYYGSYVPGTSAPYTGPVAAGGSGTGGIQGGIASALQVVEGIAGKQTRKRLENTVKSLSNSKSTLFNKRK